MKYEAHITIVPSRTFKHPGRGWRYSKLSGWEGGHFLTAHGNNYQRLLQAMKKTAAKIPHTRMKIERIVYDVRH